MLESIEFLKNILQIKNEQLVHEMHALSERRVVKKGEHLIEQGQTPVMLYFLIEGIFRGTLLGADGKEITDCLVSQCGVPLVANSDIWMPAQIGIEALVDSEVLYIPLNEMKRLFSSFTELTTLYQSFLMRSNSSHWELKVAICQYTAMQRYRWFLEDYPGLIDKIGHKYIASFLNMSPVTLSRLIHKEEHAGEAYTVAGAPGDKT